MGSLTPIWPVESNKVIVLTEGNDLYFRYRFARKMPTNRHFQMKITNIYGTPFLWTIDGYTESDGATFNYPWENANQIDRGASWQIFLISDGLTRVVAQGTFVRSDSPQN